ncbi:MAG: glycerol-3-phosphate 1-O-acyltransferase PlsY [Alcaligenaceae bacterium]|jgi:glycerol-3-phosphate acyltransferase PlsY|nr:glycerol-3-phosphate 1-O-acyltransferase PlsY [Alcaligenaceae bacterium]
MSSLLFAVIFAVIGYLIGSVSFAVISSKLLNLEDPRSYGSGNPGATNVLRSGNKKAAIITLLGDLLKGYVAVLVAIKVVELWHLSPWLVTIATIAVFLGHVYSIMLGFKGGKGVATGVGVLLALSPLLGLICIATWLLVAILFKYSSLAAIISAVMAPIYYLFLNINSGTFAWPWFIAILVVVSWLLYKHKKNIDNLMNGKESKIGSKKVAVAKPATLGSKKKRNKKH